ncbi:MAG: hypothetical protein MUE44_08135 [Oscillatoriaceae cyanobacterium Prado104]|jgi:hypothetical protein|nr:hypothetical protein [Oscillatoriaceae cyanobacterium Prado104]
MTGYSSCECFAAHYSGRRVTKIKLHSEQQDLECDAWKRLLELVEVAAKDEREEFAPRREMQEDDWQQIITLPATIAKLKSVKHLMLYVSNLVRIPPEIGEMTNLEKFTPHTSYRLHWFPYEITRCKQLKDSTVSTRALYGNYGFFMLSMTVDEFLRDPSKYLLQVEVSESFVILQTNKAIAELKAISSSKKLRPLPYSSNC